MEILKYRKDKNSEWQYIPAIIGPQGEQGPAGADYVLTDDDKSEIASLVLAQLPSSEEVGY